MKVKSNNYWVTKIIDYDYTLLYQKYCIVYRIVLYCIVYFQIKYIHFTGPSGLEIAVNYTVFE